MDVEEVLESALKKSLAVTVEAMNRLTEVTKERDFLIKYLVENLDCNKCPCGSVDHCCSPISTFTCINAVEKWLTDKMEEEKKNERD